MFVATFNTLCSTLRGCIKGTTHAIIPILPISGCYSIPLKVVELTFLTFAHRQRYNSRLHQLRDCRDTRENFKVVTLLGSMLLSTVRSYYHHRWLWLTRACPPQIVIWQKAGYRACYKSVKALYDCTLWLRSVVETVIYTAQDKQCFNYIMYYVFVQFLATAHSHTQHYAYTQQLCLCKSKIHYIDYIYLL